MEEPRRPSGGEQICPIASNIQNGITKWNYPGEWVMPLRWYWKGLEFVKTDNDTSKLGVMWIELAIDSELATWAILNGGN